MSTPTEEIKSRIGIEEVVREYVKLTQAGTNWKGLCPFHNEKTPSFVVSPDKQICHCFGCGEGGDIFSFMMKVEGIEFKDALKILADKAGVELKAQNPEQIDRRNRLSDINDLAKKFFSYLLNNSPEAENAREYLKNRGVSKESIDSFEIGYAPNAWDKLLNFLLKKGYSEKDILASGVVVEKDGGKYYDRFRNRIMFPLNNLHGQTVGFSARALDPEDNAKYVNSPQTEIYNKSEILYGLDKAKNDARKLDQIILVEGQMDLISAHSVGTTNTVATSGTALTEQQIKILKRYTDNILLAFDSDTAGQNAIKRGIDLALTAGLNVKVLTIPGEKDPDDCIKENKENWFKAIKDSQSILDYYFNETFKDLDPSTVDGKKEATKILLPIISKIPNLVEQEHYIKKLSKKLDTSEETLRGSLEKKEDTGYNRSLEAVTPIKDIIKKKREDYITEQTISLFLKYPQTLEFFSNRVDSDFFTDKKLAVIYKDLVSFYRNSGNNFIFDKFLSDLKERNESNFNVCQTLLLLAEKDFLDSDIGAIERQLVANLNFLEKSYILTRKKALEDEVKKMEESENDEQVDEILKEISELSGKLVELEEELEK